MMEDTATPGEEFTLSAFLPVLEDTAVAGGEFTLKLFHPVHGTVKELIVPNLLVTTGKEAMADRIYVSGTAAPPKYIAIGTGNTAPAAGNTALATELKRKEATWSRSGAVLTGSVEFAPGEGTGKLAEAGVLTASSGGTLYSRATFEAFEKTAELGFLVSWALTIN